jgi:hypothetical protein
MNKNWQVIALLLLLSGATLSAQLKENVVKSENERSLGKKYGVYFMKVQIYLSIIYKW